MSDAARTVQIATLVPADLADRLRILAQQNERKLAAELRLAARAWVEAAETEKAA